MTSTSIHLTEFLGSPMAKAVNAEMGDEVFMRLAYLTGALEAVACDFDFGDILQLIDETEPCRKNPISIRRQQLGLN